MGHITELAKKLSDPTLTWNIARSFGGWVRRQAVSTSNPQTLHVCDEIICIPTRFSEYLYWQDGSGNLVSRIFPNHPEAWDHTNETNPTTSAPYNGLMGGVVGYSGYFFAIDLTDGSTKSRVHITKRTYPELQILVFNKGTLAIRVNDPPSGFGLSKYTTGTAGSGYTDIGQNQYVVFYKTTRPSVDTANGVFAQSPLGSSKLWSYELYTDSVAVYVVGIFETLGFNLYTGIKAPKDILGDKSFMPSSSGTAWNRGGINVSGIIESNPVMEVYDYDPYCLQGTWSNDNFAYAMVVGWGEDEGGNSKFILVSALEYKHTTKKEQRGQTLVGVLYDADLDEFFGIRIIKPIVNMYSYGQGGAVINPFTAETILPSGRDASVSRAISSSDSVLEWTSPAPSSWTYYDAYALMNCYDTPSECRAAAALGIYTDDTGVSIPSDVRSAFAVGGITALVRRFGLQVKPFMDRSLSAGKTYAVVTRFKIFPRTATGTDLLNWAKKKYPYRISDTEWASLLSVPPFAVALAGGLPPSGSITFNVSGTPAPGQTITISGTGKRANATVWVALVDPDTYTVIAKNSGTSDASGNFSVSLTIPTTASAGKTYKLYIIA
jgi:hypothetical protein